MNLQSAIDNEVTRVRERQVSSSPIPLDDHSVQFYENEDYLSDLVSTFLCAGFAAGEPAVVVARESRRRAFCARLTTAGVDVERACRSGQLTLLDAQQTLGELLVDGAPDRERFRKVVGGLMADKVNAASHGSVRAYGEMVDVLWQGGRRDAALCLEQMWNDLQRELPFKLLCAYAMDGFSRERGRPSRYLPGARQRAPLGAPRIASAHRKPHPGARNPEPWANGEGPAQLAARIAACRARPSRARARKSPRPQARRTALRPSGRTRRCQDDRRCICRRSRRARNRPRDTAFVDSRLRCAGHDALSRMAKSIRRLPARGGRPFTVAT